jgi:nicotinamide-nucleotide amidase
VKAEIITIGDELLLGQVINTNQAYISEKLTGIGVNVERMTTIADDMQTIVDAFADAWPRSDVVISTGGLGPTHDDVTKKAVCTFFDTTLVSNDEVRNSVETFLKKRNIGWSSAAQEQTMVPAKANVIPNPVGTAAGFLFTEQNKICIVLPGVPYEMKAMIDETVIPYLAKKVTGSAIRHLTLRTTGVPESILAHKIGNLDEILSGARLAFLPSPTGVRMRITVQDRDTQTAERRVHDVERRIRARVQKYIYGTDEEELEEVVGRILTKRKLTLAIAESCTGGLIADRITNVSGSSAYFDRGVVAYSNRSKVELLGVPNELIEKHGAVSKEVAEAMADGIRRKAKADIGISTTGIAGPTGGSDEKPLGLVWIGGTCKASCIGAHSEENSQDRMTEWPTYESSSLLKRQLKSERR